MYSKSCQRVDHDGLILEVGVISGSRYETPRVVRMTSWQIGLTYRLIQIGLFIYLVG